MSEERGREERGREERRRSELDAEKERLSRLTPFERAVVGLLGVLVAGMLLVLAQLAVPYRPLEVYGYSFVPEAACPNEPVEVVLEWEVRDHLRRLDVEYAWVPGGEPGGGDGPDGDGPEPARYELARYGGGYAVYGVEPRGRERLRSPIERETPAEPGEWRLVTTYAAYGSRLGLPLRAEERAVSAGALEVLPGDEPPCAGARGAGARGARTRGGR